MARDPRYRPYRFALWAFYFALIAISSGAVVVSVVRNLRGPHRPPATGALPTRAAMRVCLTELEGLAREQNARAWRLGEEVGHGDAIARWNGWSRDWEQRVGDLSDRCRLDAGGPEPEGFAARDELARARDALLALHRAYRAQVNRFGQDDEDLARRVADALREARDAAAR